MPPLRVLLLPGWRDADAEHWQSRWQRLHGYQRVTQDDWQWPRRGDWMARLEEVLFESAVPAVLVAHGLGCQLVAAWAAHSRHTARVAAALLVAPLDPERDDAPPNLYSWRPIVRARLPFAALVVSSADDPFCAPERAAQMASDWGARQQQIGGAGHVDSRAGLGDWAAGQSLLRELLGAER